MILNIETHARIQAGGGYKTRNNSTKGGCCRLKSASSLSLKRKEVDAI